MNKSTIQNSNPMSDKGPQSPSALHDVIIVGAGPVGLFLACELGLAGVSVLVLEQTEDLRSPWKAAPMGARGLNIPSVEAFYRRGLLTTVLPPRVAPEGESVKNDQKGSRKFAGHFAGIILEAGKVNFERWTYHLPGPAATGAKLYLQELEEALSRHATSLGVIIKRGIEVNGLEETEGTVTVRSASESFEARWVVGCDGGRSSIRKLVGFEFVGSEAKFTGYTALVELVNPEKLRPGFNPTSNGMYMMPGPGNIGIIDFDNATFDRSQAVSLEHLQAVLRRVSETDVTIKTVHLASTYTDRAMQATEYRKGRVLLAGDSAHIHSPLGGQGLNTGFGDAINLGWKLAATLKGTAPAGLLDTYVVERHPAGAWSLDWTRAQVAIMRPDAFGRAIAGIMKDLMSTQEGTSYFVERFLGLSQRYELGGEHPLIGRSAPDFELEDSSRLGQYLEKGKGLLVDFESNQALALVANEWKESVDYLAAKAKNSLGLCALLIRPDGVVAWATDTNSEVSELTNSLSRWFMPSKIKS